MSHLTYFENPSSYEKKNAFFSEGSSPHLLSSLISFLKCNKENIEELHLVWYLFNNKLLHDALVSLTDDIDNINVVTIPLEGFDDRFPSDIIDRETNEVVYEQMTKRSLGLPIFRDHYKQRIPQNYKLYVFPHVYIRSAYVTPFSRGRMPYSLHAKCGLIRFKDGSSKAIVSSSNLAVRDKVKEENLSIIDVNQETANIYESFMNDLIEESIILHEFHKNLNVRNKKFEWKMLPTTNDISIISPFYYNSGFKTENFLIQKIKNAKKRVWIMAQHLASINYKVPKNYHSEIENVGESRESILKIIADQCENIEVKFASQTYVPSDSDSRLHKGLREPLNKKNFKELSNYLHAKEGVSYYVNSDIHSKFIVIDDEVIITTFNFTPTPFIFLDNVVINRFVKMPDQEPFEGVYSEVGIAISSRDQDLVCRYVEYFEGVINRDTTHKIYPM